MFGNKKQVLCSDFHLCRTASCCQRSSSLPQVHIFSCGIKTQVFLELGTQPHRQNNTIALQFLQMFVALEYQAVHMTELLIHPSRWINDERMAVHCLESGCIGLYIPSDLEISLGPRDVPRASPSGHLSGLGKSLGRQGCTTQCIPPLGSVRIQYYTNVLKI